MGKRGPKPKTDKTVLSTRILVETKHALLQAAKKNRRKISGEVEHRLRRSFENERDIIENWGGPEIHAVLRAIAAAMNLAGQATEFYAPRQPWFTSAYGYDQAVKAAIRVLEVFRPEGDPTPPENRGLTIWDHKPNRRELKKHQSESANVGLTAGDEIMNDVMMAEPVSARPNERIPHRVVVARRIASDLATSRPGLSKRRRP